MFATPINSRAIDEETPINRDDAIESFMILFLFSETVYGLGKIPVTHVKHDQKSKHLSKLSRSR